MHFLNKAGPAHVMAFDATVGNQRALVLLDLGSSSNFMSRALQEKLKAPLIPVSMHDVQTAGGNTVKIIERCNPS